MSVWQAFDVPEAGYFNLFNEAIRAAEDHGELFLPVDSGFQVIASDYSGQHRGASHEVYSFVITTGDALEEWLPLRASFRQQFLPDGRRLSFKQLREAVRKRAYPHFLNLCGMLRANVVTVMIDNQVGSLIDGGPTALAMALDDCFVPGTPTGSVEKIYRLAICVAMLQAGLRREEQPSLWVSDHDETLDTQEKRECFARLGSYLTYGLTGRRNSADAFFMTTMDKQLPEWGEDLSALPDIAAGACAHLGGHLPLFLNQRSWVASIYKENSIDWRAEEFATWLAKSDGVLRHILLRLEQDQYGEVRASAQRFLPKKKHASDLI